MPGRETQGRGYQTKLCSITLRLFRDKNKVASVFTTHRKIRLRDKIT